MRVKRKARSSGGRTIGCRPSGARYCGAVSWALPVMVAAVMIRLLSAVPGVPVPHWHGTDGRFHTHAGGGLPHDHGDQSGDGPQPDGHFPVAAGYYSPNSAAVEDADASQTVPMEQAAGWPHPLWVRVPESQDGVEDLQARAPPQPERTELV